MSSNNNKQPLVKILASKIINSTASNVSKGNFGSLGIKQQYLGVVTKWFSRPFTFEVKVRDSQNVIRTLRFTNIVLRSRLTPDTLYIPVKLNPGWNEFKMDLDYLINSAFETKYQETVRIQVYPNCYLKTVYFASSKLMNGKDAVDITRKKLENPTSDNDAKSQDFNYIASVAPILPRSASQVIEVKKVTKKYLTTSLPKRKAENPKAPKIEVAFSLCIAKSGSNTKSIVSVKGQRENSMPIKFYHLMDVPVSEAKSMFITRSKRGRSPRSKSAGPPPPAGKSEALLMDFPSCVRIGPDYKFPSDVQVEEGVETDESAIEEECPGTLAIEWIDYCERAIQVDLLPEIPQQDDTGIKILFKRPLGKVKESDNPDSLMDDLDNSSEACTEEEFFNSTNLPESEEPDSPVEDYLDKIHNVLVSLVNSDEPEVIEEKPAPIGELFSLYGVDPELNDTKSVAEHVENGQTEPTLETPETEDMCMSKSAASETVLAAEDMAKSETVPATEDKPKSVTVLATEDMAKSEAVPATEDKPKSETVLATEDMAKSETVPATEDKPKSETVQAPEDMLKSETVPATEDMPNTETEPTITDPTSAQASGASDSYTPEVDVGDQMNRRNYECTFTPEQTAQIISRLNAEEEQERRAQAAEVAAKFAKEEAAQFAAKLAKEDEARAIEAAKVAKQFGAPTCSIPSFMDQDKDNQTASQDNQSTDKNLTLLPLTGDKTPDSENNGGSQVQEEDVDLYAETYYE